MFNHLLNQNIPCNQLTHLEISLNLTLVLSPLVSITPNDFQVSHSHITGYSWAVTHAVSKLQSSAKLTGAIWALTVPPRRARVGGWGAGHNPHRSGSTAFASGFEMPHQTS